MRAGSKVEHLQDEQGLILSQLVNQTQTKKRQSFKSLFKRLRRLAGCSYESTPMTPLSIYRDFKRKPPAAQALNNTSCSPPSRRQ